MALFRHTSVALQSLKPVSNLYFQKSAKEVLQRNRSSYMFSFNKSNSPYQNVQKQFYSQIVDDGAGTYKPTPLQQKILVWGKFYPSVDKVPDRITKDKMKKAMDKFRIRVSLIMVAMTLIGSVIMAAIGRHQRAQGLSVAGMNLARAEQIKSSAEK